MQLYGKMQFVHNMNILLKTYDSSAIQDKGFIGRLESNRKTMTEIIKSYQLVVQHILQHINLLDFEYVQRYLCCQFCVNQTTEFGKDITKFT